MTWTTSASGMRGILGVVLALWSGPRCLAAHSLLSSSEATELREVEIRVSLRDGGQPIAGIGVKAKAQGGEASGRTDQQGSAALSLTVASDASWAAVYPAALASESGTPAERIQSVRQNHDRLGGFAFARWYPIVLEPGRTTYSIEIDAPTARKCVVSATGPDGGSVHVATASANGTIGNAAALVRETPVAVGGLPKGRASIVYAWAEGCLIERIVVPAGDEDHAAAVTLRRPGGSCEVEITVAFGTAADWRPEPIVAGVTLVSLDGQTRLTLSVRKVDGVWRVVPGPGTNDLPKLPPGTYYVVGHSFAATAPQRAVIERALAGEDLRPHEVPTVTAVEGEVARLALDISAAERALLGSHPTRVP